MVKEDFLVVGKQKINSQKGVFFMIHLVTKFTDYEAVNASGRKAVTTMVTQEEFDNIKLGKYNGYVIRNGRYTNIVFDQFLEASPQ